MDRWIQEDNVSAALIAAITQEIDESHLVFTRDQGSTKNFVVVKLRTTSPRDVDSDIPFAPSIINQVRDALARGLGDRELSAITVVKTGRRVDKGVPHNDEADSTIICVLTVKGTRTVRFFLPTGAVKTIECQPGHIYMTNAHFIQHQVQQYSKNSVSIIFRRLGASAAPRNSCPPKLVVPTWCKPSCQIDSYLGYDKDTKKYLVRYVGDHRVVYLFENQIIGVNPRWLALCRRQGLASKSKNGEYVGIVGALTRSQKQSLKVLPTLLPPGSSSSETTGCTSVDRVDRGVCPPPIYHY